MENMSEVKHIVVTGFSGTGSSAVIDMLKEFDGCDGIFGKKDYEDYFLTAPDALFDLEWKLLYNNDPHRSDEAIERFLKVMTKFYENDFNWFGGYKKNIGTDFIDNVHEFINSIASTSDKTWYYHYNKRTFSLIRFLYRFFRYKIKDPSLKLDGIHVKIDKEPIYISYPSEAEFFEKSKKYFNQYLNMIGSNSVTIHDHLIWPMHVKEIDKYFDDTFRFIIVHRDARDVFLTNKYLYIQKGAFGTYPTEANEFNDYWKRLLNMGEVQEHKNVLHINFEDLIYQYENMADKIASFCQLDKNSWSNKGKYFKPEKSMKNTQLSLMNEVCKEEGQIIERALPELIYHFPYEIKTSLGEMFV